MLHFLFKLLFFLTAVLLQVIGFEAATVAEQFFVLNKQFEIY